MKQLCCIVLLALTVSSCANKITWSEADSKAFLIDYGYHSSLVLQDENGEYWEYTYGDWQWFAKNRSQWWRLPVTLFWPTTATLARGHYPSKDVLERHLERFVTERFVLEVEAKKAHHLIEELNSRFDEVAKSRGDFYQPFYQMTFVPLSSESYHVFHNCNHVLVKWLERLGLEVQGLHLFSSWDVGQKR